MTSLDKWNAFSAYADLPVALFMLLAGITLVASQKKFAAAREVRVSSGELSKEEARKNAMLVRCCSYFITGCGALLVIIWALGF